MSEEELCERICQLEKELKEEKEKNEELKTIIKAYDSLEGNTENKIIIFDKTSAMVNGELFINRYISKDKIRDLIAERKFELQQEYEDFENDIKLKILQELLKE